MLVQQQPSTTLQSPPQPPSSLNPFSSIPSLFTSPSQHKSTSRIEAMASFPSPLSFIPSLHPTHPHLSSPRSTPYDPSTRHPVFFTQSLRKPPFPIRDGSGGGFSPVAFGYVVERGVDERDLGVRWKLWWKEKHCGCECFCGYNGGIVGMQIYERWSCKKSFGVSQEGRNLLTFGENQLECGRALGTKSYPDIGSFAIGATYASMALS